MNWQTHAYFGEQSGVSYIETFMVDGAKNEEVDWASFQRFIKNYQSGYLLVHAESKLYQLAHKQCTLISWVDPKPALYLLFPFYFTL